MDEVLKQKIVGALVVFALLVVFLPAIFNEPMIESSLIKVDVPDRPNDLLAVEFPVAVSHNMLRALEHDLKHHDDNERNDEGGVDGVPDAAKKLFAARDIDQLRDVVSDLVQNIKDGSSVDNGEHASVSIRAWTVQLASFIKIEYAQKLNARLRSGGEKSYFKKYKVAGGQVFRVYVGPTLSEVQAREIKQRLKEQYQLDGLITRYVPD